MILSWSGTLLAYYFVITIYGIMFAAHDRTKSTRGSPAYCYDIRKLPRQSSDILDYLLSTGAFAANAVLVTAIPEYILSLNTHM